MDRKELMERIGMFLLFISCLSGYYIVRTNYLDGTYGLVFSLLMLTMFLIAVVYIVLKIFIPMKHPVSQYEVLAREKKWKIVEGLLFVLIFAVSCDILYDCFGIMHDIARLLLIGLGSCILVACCICETKKTKRENTQ